MRRIATTLTVFGALLFGAGDSFASPRCKNTTVFGMTGEFYNWGAFYAQGSIGSQSLNALSQQATSFQQPGAVWHNCNGPAVWLDGKRYLGQWSAGKPYGQGTFTYANGDKHVGGYRDGKRHGQGTYTFASGAKYVGEFRDGEYHGQGTLTFSDGDRYVGEFRDDKYHGHGTYIWPNGKVQRGLWRNDKFAGTRSDIEEASRIKKRQEHEARRRSAAMAAATNRCLYKDLDKITSNAAERIVRQKCIRELRTLSLDELEEAYN